MTPSAPAAAHVRMRRYRARQRAGVVRVAINLSPALITLLVDLGWLPPDKRDDRGAVNEAFRAFTRCAAGFSARAPALFRAPSPRHTQSV